MNKPWWGRLDGLPPHLAEHSEPLLEPASRVRPLEHVEALRHPVLLIRRVQEKRPGARGAARTMLGGISAPNVFAFNLWIGAILLSPAVAVGGLIAAVLPDQSAGERGGGVLAVIAGFLSMYVVGCLLLRRGARYLN